MSKYYNVNIDSGTAAGPYTVYHTEVNPSNIATLFSNAQPAVNITHYSIISNNGVLVIVPDDATRIILYNQECDTYEDNLVTYTITAGSSNVNEGESITLNVTTKNVPDNTVLYWKINYNNSSSDPDFFTAVTGTTTIVNRVSTFSVSLESDLTTEGSETFYVELRTDSISGTIVDSTDIITINDTSRYYYYLVKDTYNCEAYGNATAYYKVNTDYGDEKLVKVNGQGDNKWLMRNESQQNDGDTASFVDVTNCVQGTPTYSITEPQSNVDEGSTVVFAINTTYVRDYTTLYWKINFNSSSESSDFVTYTLSGTTTIINGSGVAEVRIYNDQENDIPSLETFYMELRAKSATGPIVATSGIVSINDTSLSAPTYNITGPTTVNENASAVFNVTTTNLPNGTVLYWRVNYNNESTDSNDFETTSGTVTINNNSGSISVSTTNDNITEGTELFRVDLMTSGLRNADAVATTLPVQILDTSTYPTVQFTYSQTCIGTSSTSGRVTFTNVTGGNGGPYYVTINGTDWSEWTGSSFRIDNIADGTYNLRAKDGLENLSSISSITVDCYRAPTYSISASPLTINEPGAVTFSVTTQYVPNGTTLYWTTEHEIGSSSPADFYPSTGTVTINSVGTGTFDVGILADNFTDGTETFKVRLRTGGLSGNNIVATSQTITIYDTSVNTQPIWVSRNYITCYNCTNYTVYQNTNPNSPPSIKDYYRIGESGPTQSGAPTGGVCNTDAVYGSPTYGCSGCTKVTTRTNINPCSYASPIVTTESDSGYCFSTGQNCCGSSNRIANYQPIEVYECDGCQRYQLLQDINPCSSTSGNRIRGNAVGGGNNADCGGCCGQSTTPVYSQYVSERCDENTGVIYVTYSNTNPCALYAGTEERASDRRCAAWTSAGSFHYTCADAIAGTYNTDPQNGLVQPFTIVGRNGEYRFDNSNGGVANGTFYDGGVTDSSYPYYPRPHFFSNGSLTIGEYGCTP